jgi:hypothetical protein
MPTEFLNRLWEMWPDLAHAQLWLYTGAGVAILWGKMKTSQRSVYGLTAIINSLVPETRPRLRSVIEIICYLVVGCFVAMGVLAPATPGQAFAAGLGWTGLTTR